jgi:AcrR family transcriptional regulator
MSRSLEVTAASAVKKGETYHHGNLRQALVQAARELAAEVGVDAFTLREVARRAGVSHAAPYHHFNDKAQLVRVLAIEAFEALTNEMLEAARNTQNAHERFSAIGLAYVRFAFKYPAEFRFMFRKDLCLTDDAADDPLEDAGKAAYMVLQNGIRVAQQAGLIAPGDPEILSLTAWSTVHGLAMILLDAPTGQTEYTPEQIDRMARAVIETLSQGLKPR